MKVEDWECPVPDGDCESCHLDPRDCGRKGETKCDRFVIPWDQQQGPPKRPDDDNVHCERCGVPLGVHPAPPQVSDDEKLVERIAEAIYRHRGGISPEEYETIMGKKQRAWKTDAPWDTNPDELCEHERDDYRVEARAVLDVLRRDLETVASSVASALEEVAVGDQFVGADKETWLHFLLPLAAKLRVALRRR